MSAYVYIELSFQRRLNKCHSKVYLKLGREALKNRNKEADATSLALQRIKQ